ncbi:hypothetical protein EK21DRAFT_88877 [Setomelanomma holmii]|uniref:DUF7730 domain-containing protein n=1 Tax=Setomelanomma holmii TaxID=210430 RepID=A0A9P4HAA9_9PLEO|nr:hypothetical protein EK21DRAFT_88877 [Setomelanomma holmii]
MSTSSSVHSNGESDIGESTASESIVEFQTPKKILKGKSLLAEPCVPSFFNGLAPEIRNQVYDALFVKSEFVEVTPDYAKDSDSDHDGGSYNPNLIKALGYLDDVWSSRIRDTRLSLARAMSLLRSCRQIYHRAVGILYTRNHFTLFSQHRLSHKLYHWLDSITSQRYLLTRITISPGVLERKNRRIL